jgi:kynurenine formamidase
MFTDVDPIDLSIGLEGGSPSEPWPPSVDHLDHRDGAEDMAERLREMGAGDVTPDDFPDGVGLGWETVHAITHTGTHVDAPAHYGPETDGEPARTIDELPVEWFCGEAVVLDVREKDPGTEITPEDLDDRLEALGHDLSPGEIVLLETGADDLWGTPEYLTEFPGLGGAAVRHLTDQGVRVVGTDAYGLDKPFAAMADRYAETGDPAELWPAHFAGREREYCQIEKMANLDRLPRRTGVPIVTVPVKVVDGTAGWARPVAMV